MSRPKTRKELGYSLENCVADHFFTVGYDKARRSKGSGNRGELGDISGVQDFVVECKRRTTKNITIQEAVWKKLCNEIPLHSRRKPLYILENMNKKFWAVLEMNDFFELLKGYLENEKRKETEV